MLNGCICFSSTIEEELNWHLVEN